MRLNPDLRLSPRERKNLFGFGKKKTGPKRRKPSMTFSQMVAAAKDAGRKGENFRDFLNRKHLDYLEDRGYQHQLDRLAEAYHAGMDTAREQVREKEHRAEVKHEAKADLADALQREKAAKASLKEAREAGLWPSALKDYEDAVKAAASEVAEMRRRAK